MKKTLITLYYSVTVFAVAASVAYAVFVGSVHVTFGRQVARLETEKQQLLKQRNELKHQLAEAHSLDQVKTYAQHNNYVAITRPVTLTTLSNIASR
jgi:hypothetical protein